jgi:pyruvate formate lyase activating enzyme
MEAYIDSNIGIDYEYIEGQPSMIVNFAGCNFNCPICFVPNYVKFSNDFLIDLKVIKSEIERISPNVDNVVFTGGEPTLQRLALGSLCRFSRSFQLSIWLHSNASKPEVIKYLLMNELCNNFIIDIKAPLEEEIFQKSTQSANFFMPSSEIIEDVKRTIEILYEHLPNITVEFRTTVFPGVIYTEKHFESICKSIAHLHPNLIIQNFRYDKEEGILNKSLLRNKAPSTKHLEHIKEHLEKTFPQIDIQIR